MNNFYCTFITLAWPLILSNITIPLLGMVDIAVIGHQNNPQLLASIAIGSMLFDTLFLLFGFLRMSTTGLIAQAPNNIYILYRALLMAIFLSVILIICHRWIFNIAMSLLHINHSTEIILSRYFSVRIYSAIPTLINFVLYGYFFGKQNTKAPLVLLLLINVSGIGLDFILVNYFQLAEIGIAMANILSQTLGSVVGWLILWPKLNKLSSINLKHPTCHGLSAASSKLMNSENKLQNVGNVRAISLKRLFQLDACLQLFKINRDIFIRTLCLLSTLSFFTFKGSTFGTAVISANAILLSIHHFTSYALDAFAIACESLVGQALYEKNLGKFKTIIKQCFHLSFIFAISFSLAIYFLGSEIIHLMTSIPTVLRETYLYQGWLILLPIASVASYVLDGVFIGATWSKEMRNAMMFSVIGIFFPLAWLLSSYQNHGLWLAFILFMIARGITLQCYLSYKLHHNCI